VEVGPLGYVARFLMIFFFIVLVHEASHALAHPRDVKGVFIGFNKRQGIVLAIDVEKNTTLSLLLPQLLVPASLACLWAAGYIHWVEAVMLAPTNIIPSQSDISLLRGKAPTPTRTWRVGIYLEPPHLRIGWI